MTKSTALPVVAFLKKYTTVSDAFIDDFFSLVDPSAGKKDFVIPADAAAKWLGMTKGNLLRALKIHGFIEASDYTVSKEASSLENNGSKRPHRRPMNIVMMTTECFKSLCMLMNTPKSKMTRSYYIAVEDALLKYRDEIVAGLQQRVIELERNQKTYKHSQGDAPGVIYVLRAPSGSITPNRLGMMSRKSRRIELYKLGMTSNFIKRMESHQSALPDNLEVMWVFKTEHMARVEACAKGVLKNVKYRKYKEVYQTDLDSIKSIVAGCEELCREVKPFLGKRAKVGGGQNIDHFMIIESLNE